MSNNDINDKSKIKSLLKLYGSEKFKINPNIFEKLPGNLNQQITESINLIYSKKNKVDNNGYYIFSFVVITIFIFIYLRGFIYNFFEHAKNNWDVYKCDPRIIPYSGYVKKSDDKTEFESTGDNFNECIEPISEYISSLKFDPFQSLVNDLNNISDMLNTSLNNIQESLNNLKDEVNTTLNLYSENDNNKNQTVHKTATGNLDIYKKLEAFMQSLSELYNGTNLTIQSLLTYVYVFFEGALVMLSLIIIPLTIMGSLIVSIALGLVTTGGVIAAIPFGQPFAVGILSYASITLPIGLAILVTAFAFFVIFLVVVIFMILYKGFLKDVFGIDVDKKKTKTPPSPL